MIEGLQDILKADSSRATKMDCTASVEEYINKSDWRINANANTGYSSAGLVNNLAGKAIANYWLDKVYSKKEGDAHRNGDYHIHDLDCLQPYCCGHDLQTLLQEGFNGVVSRVSSKPPKHFREALGQMANFIGILQSEWAGAQAFSSFDTLLAPYVFFDMMVEGITERDVKKALLSFIYNLNVPSRWGQCVNSSYKCLRADGKWVSHDELQVGESIYVVDVETGELKLDTVTHVNVFDAPEKMHHYSNEQGFNFDVTPNHRVIYKTGSNPFSIKESAELIGKKSPIYIPISSWNTPTPENFMGNEYNITDELLELITFIMCDGCIVNQEGKTARIEFYKSPNRYGCDRFEELCAILGVEYSVTTDESAKFEGSYCNKYRLMNSDVTKAIINLLGGDKHKCPDFMKYLSPRQAYIVLDTWVLLDGHFDGCHWKMQADNKEIQEMLAFLTVISGKSVSLNERLIGENKNATIYTNIHKRGSRACSVTEIDAKTDKVWCPTTNTGTFVCMTDEGYVFLTGNSPFSNVTIDMTVPQTMRFLSPQRGEEPYFVRNWREFLEAENLTDDPDEALERNEGWNRLIEEARKRIGDYDSDEETILYSLTYQHFAPEMMIINKAYYEILSEGDCTGQPFTFPIPTVNITEDFDWDNPEYDFLFENAARYGSSYFQNFIGSQYLRDENGNLTIRDENAYSPNDLRSMCCRLQLSKKALRKRGGGLFGSDAQTGSIGVVTINMARLGYLYKGDIKGLYKRLTVLMDMARSTLDKKRAFVEEMYLRGLYPYTRRYVKTYDTYFSTIGVNGMNEMVRNFTNDEYDITDERGQKMCMEILDYMNKKMEAYQEDGKALWNLEATPAEGTTTRFAREDIKRYPDIIQAGFPDAPYYTNSSQLPVDFSSDVFSTLDLQDELQKKYTGGCVEAGNYVITDRGRILIDELCNNPDKYKGIKVISYNTSTNSSEWDLVTDFHKIDVSQKDKIHVVGNGGLDIVTSDWHPFFVVTDDGTVIEKRADELKKNDYVLCNSTVMFDDSDKELTPELAYVIGFYIGDGSMSLTHDNRGGNNISKHNVRFHHSNEDRIRHLEKILIDNKLCFAKARKCDKRSKNLMCIGTTKKSMYEFLNKYGFTDGEKSKTVHFSDTLKSQLNKKNAFALLSGLFDTDAHVDPITDDMEYFTASEELAKDIVYLCSMLGIKCSYSIKNDKRYDHSHYRLYIPAKSLYEVEDELMSFRKPTGVSKDKVSHKSIIKNNYNVVRVTDVSKCDVDDNVFYDLTTEKNHNYLCGKRNYVFIHNTVLHIYNDEDVTSEECKLLLKKVLTNYRLPYVSFTATFSSCPKHGRISGIHEYCPLCDKELMQKHLSEIDLNKA